MHSQQNIPSDKKTPLVSFIIPVYNTPAKYLRTCLEHILQLSTSAAEREIIVVDDGSSNDILRELDGMTDMLTYIRTAHQGLSMARNTGWMLAKGTYMQFVDSDDHLINVPYEHCLDIVRYNNPDMVTFQLTEKETTGTPLNSKGPVTGTQHMLTNNLRASACGYIFRREAAGDLRFTQGITHEDEEFTPLLMLRCESVYTTDAEAYLYRTTQGSITNTNDEGKIRKRLCDMEEVLYRLNERTLQLSGDDREALERRVAQLTMDIIYRTMTLTRGNTDTEQLVERLKEHQLFPLPDKHYTHKYDAFRKMTDSQVMRKMMTRLVPRK